MESETIDQLRRKLADTEARLDERNHIIANLSHSIKNLLNSSVIGPLQSLHTLEPRDEAIVQDALRGADLIGQIVVAMNLSYRGSEADYLYDAQHPDDDSADLNALIFQSFQTSLGNVFDGRHFRSVQLAYFPEDNAYDAAYRDWMQVRDTSDWTLLRDFAQKHFFDLDVDLNPTTGLILGNEKHSRIKMFLLLQEIVFNAVKYSGFVVRGQRSVRFSLTRTPEQVSLLAENTYDPQVRYTTTGIGHSLIENFAKLLNTVPVVSKTDERFTLSLTFRNFWEH